MQVGGDCGGGLMCERGVKRRHGTNAVLPLTRPVAAAADSATAAAAADTCARPDREPADGQRPQRHVCPQPRLRCEEAAGWVGRSRHTRGPPPPPPPPCSSSSSTGTHRHTPSGTESHLAWLLSTGDLSPHTDDCPCTSLVSAPPPPPPPLPLPLPLPLSPLQAAAPRPCCPRWSTRLQLRRPPCWVPTPRCRCWGACARRCSPRWRGPSG